MGTVQFGEPFKRQYRNYDDFLGSYCRYLRTSGEKIRIRDSEVLEVCNQHFTILRPWERWCGLESRKPNPVATIAETLWVLGGRSDVEFIKNYLPTAENYSDDGKTWGAGYGPRLRSFETTTTDYQGEADTCYTDQIEYVIRELTRDQSSRRAVISLWDVSRDSDIYHVLKDVPCNNTLQFLVRGNKLHLIVTSRSMDLIWGSMINVFEWSVLMELVASKLKMMSLGQMYYNVGSLHVYDRHYEMMRNVASEWEDNYDKVLYAGGEEIYQHRPTIGVASAHLADFYHDVSRFFKHESNWMTYVHIENVPHTPDGTVLEPFVRDAVRVVWGYWQAKRGHLDSAADALAPIMMGDMGKSVYAQLEREGIHLSASSVMAMSTVTGVMIDMHNEKRKVYKDSWRRRGEAGGIVPNINRKVDRLETLDHIDHYDGDELIEDTLIDLAVYAVLYCTYLSGADEDTFDDTVYKIAGEAHTLHPSNPGGYINSILNTGRALDVAVYGLAEYMDPADAPGTAEMVAGKLHLAKQLAATAMLWYANIKRGDY